MDLVDLCDTCLLAKMCERYRCVQDACIDPITPGKAVVVECAAYMAVPKEQEVLDSGRQGATA